VSSQKSLQEVYEKYQHPGGWGDKGTLHSYIDIYEEHMNKKTNIDILEIGVCQGHSIKMWQEYFVDSNVYGVDITLKNVTFENLDNVYVCDATSEQQINEIFKDKKFDYIVDDGSHVIQHQLISFDILWHRIKPGGKYFIEDVNGDPAIKAILDHLATSDIECSIIDYRHVKNRFDDIVVMIEKPGE
jgi:hypothetical protein